MLIDDRRILNLRKKLDRLYKEFNKKKYIETDPVKFVHRYSEPENQEIVGFIVSSLSYGNVKNIFSSCERVLKVISVNPYNFFMKSKSFNNIIDSFVHRFTKLNEIENFFILLSIALKKYGRLKTFFLDCYREGQPFRDSLDLFAKKFSQGDISRIGSLLPDPVKGSACKRLNMFLRWMVRKDDIDVGIWNEIPKNKLIYPIDVHVAKISRMLKFTERKSNDWKTAQEITENFRRINPDDPLKYDFTLTRIGILNKEISEYFL
ncbi:MAG: TIGR02757 family protein [Acidobacteriota bacterium]